MLTKIQKLKKLANHWFRILLLVWAHWVLLYNQKNCLNLLTGFFNTVIHLLCQSNLLNDPCLTKFFQQTIGVLIALASQGVLPITMVFIIFGDNIGTCTTALISSLWQFPRRGKQGLYSTINVIGTVYFMLFLAVFLWMLLTHWSGNVARQIANAHTIFNIVNVIVLFPFVQIFLVVDSNDCSWWRRRGRKYALSW